MNKSRKSVANRAIKVIVVMSAIFSIFLLILGQIAIKNGKNENSNPKLLQNRPNFRQLAGVIECANDKNYVHIGGYPIGISISAGGLIVVGESAVPTSDGEVCPAKDHNIQCGDILVSVNDESVYSVYQFKKLTQSTDAVNLTFRRDGKEFSVNIKPVVDKISGDKKVGLMLKEDVGGVGTMTFVTQENQFAALGHYIIDADTGVGDELNQGHIYKSSVDDIIKGERGKAGGLVADVNRLSNPIGDICCNTNIGLYGTFLGENNGELYRIAQKGEAQIGKAQVLTTIDGSVPKFYDIDIVKVVSQDQPSEKGMVIAVKDKELLSRTGGIVQGMSGSPIVQNGILIGAVTHVFIQDPTRGYAVHSRFMYDYANAIKTDNLNEDIEEIYPLVA